jgi:hypothetical protein
MWLPLVLLAVLCGCENKRDSSDLAGQWQLLEWRDASGKTVGTKEDGIYYRFQLSLLQLEFSYYCKYVETPDSLILLGAYKNKYNVDTQVPFSEFAEFGIPQDGRFGIDALNGDDLVLSGKSGVLRFRRY